LTAGCCDLCVVTCVCVCVTTSTYLNYDYLNCYFNDYESERHNMSIQYAD
jgi:hypothetical protein